MTPDDPTSPSDAQAERRPTFTPDPPIDAGKLAVVKDRQGTARFRCVGCSEDIVSFRHNGPPVCACCRAMPGWHRNPELARILHHQPGGAA